MLSCHVANCHAFGSVTYHKRISRAIGYCFGLHHTIHSQTDRLQCIPASFIGSGCQQKEVGAL